MQEHNERGQHNSTYKSSETGRQRNKDSVIITKNAWTDDNPCSHVDNTLSNKSIDSHETTDTITHKCKYKELRYPTNLNVTVEYQELDYCDIGIVDQVVAQSCIKVQNEEDLKTQLLSLTTSPDGEQSELAVTRLLNQIAINSSLSIKWSVKVCVSVGKWSLWITIRR